MRDINELAARKKKLMEDIAKIEAENEQHPALYQRERDLEGLRDQLKVVERQIAERQ